MYVFAVAPTPLGGDGFAVDDIADDEWLVHVRRLGRVDGIESTIEFETLTNSLFSSNLALALASAYSR